MPNTRREMALTADLVVRTTRLVEDAGASPGAVYMTDEDYEVSIKNVLADAPVALYVSARTRDMLSQLVPTWRSTSAADEWKRLRGPWLGEILAAG